MFYRSIRQLSPTSRTALENEAKPLKYLTEHDRWHVQVGLCLERQPLEYQEPKVERFFREFQEHWFHSTRNTLKLPSLLTIEQKITHKILPTREKVKPLEHGSSSADSPSLISDNDLESLLLSELEVKALPRRIRRVDKIQKAGVDSTLSNDRDLHDSKRYPKDWLFLAVKYKAGPWSLPTTNLYFGDSIRQTLARLCEEQFSSVYRPYFLGYCPFTHQKIPDGNDDEIRGKKIFYYRARHVPSQELDMVSNEEIDDYAWCTFEELRDRLDYVKYKRVLDSLPLI